MYKIGPPKLGPKKEPLTVNNNGIEIYYFDRAYGEVEFYGPPKVLTPGPDEMVVKVYYGYHGEQVIGRQIIKKADEERWMTVSKLDDNREQGG